jgi:hypothetical protein
VCTPSSLQNIRMSNSSSSRMLEGLTDSLSAQFAPRNCGPGWDGAGIRRGQRERTISMRALHQASVDFNADLFAEEEPQPKRPRLEVPEMEAVSDDEPEPEEKAKTPAQSKKKAPEETYTGGLHILLDLIRQQIAALLRTNKKNLDRKLKSIPIHDPEIFRAVFAGHEIKTKVTNSGYTQLTVKIRTYTALAKLLHLQGVGKDWRGATCIAASKRLRTGSFAAPPFMFTCTYRGRKTDGSGDTTRAHTRARGHGARAHTHTQKVRARTHTHMRARARTHTHAHAHTRARAHAHAYAHPYTRARTGTRPFSLRGCGNSQHSYPDHDCHVSVCARWPLRQGERGGGRHSCGLCTSTPGAHAHTACICTTRAHAPTLGARSLTGLCGESTCVAYGGTAAGVDRRIGQIGPGHVREGWAPDGKRPARRGARSHTRD